MHVARTRSQMKKRKKCKQTQPKESHFHLLFTIHSNGHGHVRLFAFSVCSSSITQCMGQHMYSVEQTYVFFQLQRVWLCWLGVVAVMPVVFFSRSLWSESFILYYRCNVYNFLAPCHLQTTPTHRRSACSSVTFGVLLVVCSPVCLAQIKGRHYGDLRSSLIMLIAQPSSQPPPLNSQHISTNLSISFTASAVFVVVADVFSFSL